MFLSILIVSDLTSVALMNLALLYLVVKYSGKKVSAMRDQLQIKNYSIKLCNIIPDASDPTILQMKVWLKI